MDIQPANFPAGSGKTELASFIGRFGFANVTLSFEVECLPGFAGESCVPVCSTDPCNNNGTCLESVSGFTCACRGDFTGETCETRINDCQDVDCNDGTCVDGVMSFTCQCDPGFTGESCEEGITTGPGSTINIGVMIGVILGVVLVLTLVIILSIALAVQRFRRSKVHKGTSISKPHVIPFDAAMIMQEYHDQLDLVKAFQLLLTQRMQTLNRRTDGKERVLTITGVMRHSPNGGYD